MIRTEKKTVGTKNTNYPISDIQLVRKKMKNN